MHSTRDDGNVHTVVQCTHWCTQCVRIVHHCSQLTGKYTSTNWITRCVCSLEGDPAASAADPNTYINKPERCGEMPQTFHRSLTHPPPLSLSLHLFLSLSLSLFISSSLFLSLSLFISSPLSLSLSLSASHFTTRTLSFSLCGAENETQIELVPEVKAERNLSHLLKRESLEARAWAAEQVPRNCITTSRAGAAASAAIGQGSGGCSSDHRQLPRRWFSESI